MTSLTVNNIDSDSLDTDGCDTNSINPTDGNVIIVTSLCWHSSALNGNGNTIANVATTWTAIGSIEYASRRRIAIWVGYGPFTEGVIALDNNEIGINGVLWSIEEVTGQAATAFDTAQVIYDTNTSSSAITIPTMSGGSPTSGTDAVFAAFGVEDSDAAPTLASPLTALSSQTGHSDARSMQAGWDGGALTDLTPQTSHTTSRGGGVGFILKGSGAGGGGSIIPQIMHYRRMMQ